ncbi:MAG TPA: hypothetical protein DHU63_05400 [Candidatus Marinimicrobia bacterium]|nr:hypothetical protein [Candidatus Neomarinimicrobiota bacterium]
MANYRQRFAELISVILHPFLLAGIMWVYIPMQTPLVGWPFWRVIVLGYLFCLILPVGYLIAQKRLGRIDGLDIRVREDRNRHYPVFFALYVLQFLTFGLLKSPGIVLAFATAYVVNTLIYAFINRWWKISIHGAGVGGPAGALLFLTGGSAWWTMLLFPFLGWSRVHLKHHTVGQVIAGMGLGFMLVYFEFYFIS